MQLLCDPLLGKAGNLIRLLRFLGAQARLLATFRTSPERETLAADRVVQTSRNLEAVVAIVWSVRDALLQVSPRTTPRLLDLETCRQRETTGESVGEIETNYRLESLACEPAQVITDDLDGFVASSGILRSNGLNRSTSPFQQAIPDGCPCLLWVDCSRSNRPSGTHRTRA